MAGLNLDQMYLANPNFVPVDTDKLYVFSGGKAYPCTVDKLAALITGFTVAESSQPSVGKTVVQLFPDSGQTYRHAAAGLLLWDVALYDTETIFSTGEGTRIPVKAGITQAELSCCLVRDPLFPGTDTSFAIYKNGDTSKPVAQGEFTTGSTIISFPVTVVGGTDYFQVVVGAECYIVADASWFSLKVLERTA